MRFPIAWAAVARNNVVLKWAVIALTLTAVTLSLVLATVANRPPLIIERSCVSQLLATSQVHPTDSEVQAFVTEALHQRFDSGSAASPAYLTLDELSARARDNAELENRNMRQRVLVNHVKREGDRVHVDADRLLSVGPVRSALVFPLVLTLGSVDRTAANPYGLVLMRSDAKKTDGEGRGEK